MERLDERRIASHRGTVKAVADGSVDVEIESTSACASCQAHSRCGFAESKQKTVTIPTPNWRNFTAGQQVTVVIDQSRGMLAVWIAYVLPALAIIAIVALLSATGAAEWLVAVSALATLGLYVGLLYLLRGKIGKKFTLTVEQC